MNPFVHQSEQRRPSARPPARPPKNFLRPLRNCVENASNRPSSGRAARILAGYALFRTEAYQSPSQFITNLDFQTFFGRDRGEGDRERGINYSSIVIHPIVSNCPIESSDPADRRGVYEFHFGTIRTASFPFSVVFFGFWVPLCLPRSDVPPDDSDSGLKIPITPRRRRHQRRRRRR